MENTIILDNGGKTFDRYTVIIGEDLFGMSHNPLSPQGFNQWYGDADYLGIKDMDAYVKHLIAEGDLKIVTLEELDNTIKEAIKQRIS